MVGLRCSRFAWSILAAGERQTGAESDHDQTAGVAAALLLFGFAFGLHRPTHAWLYPLLLFAAVPLSSASADAAWYHPGFPNPAPLYESIVALIPALLGAYTGVAIRWIASVSRA